MQNKRNLKSMYCVIVGDIINSQALEGDIREAVTQKIKDTLNRINTDYMPYTLAEFGLVRGDAFEGVLLSQEQAPKIIQEIIKSLYRVERTKVRISVVVGQLTIVSSDRNETDGPAFYKAIENINKMKEQKSDHWLQVSFDTQTVAQPLVDSLIALITALTKGWTDKQRSIVWAMEELSEQPHLVGRKLSMSTQVVNKQLKAADYEAYHKAWANLEQFLGDFEELSIDASLKHEPGYSGYYSAALRKDKQRDFDGALPLIKKSLELAKSELGEKSPQLATIYNTFADILREIKLYEEAEEAITTSLRLQEPLSKNRLEYATTLSIMGRLQVEIYKNLDKAMDYYKKAKEIAINAAGANHPFVNIYNSDIASIFYIKREYNQALKYHFETVKFAREHANDNPLNLATYLHNIALCYYEMGETENALINAEEALKICRNNLPNNHKYILESENLLHLIKDKKGVE